MEVVLRADEIGARVCELDFSLEDIEARHGAGVEAVLLVAELVGEKMDALLGDGDEFAVQQHGVKLRADVCDDGVHRLAEQLVACVLGQLGDLHRGLHFSSGVKDLLDLHGDPP